MKTTLLIDSDVLAYAVASRGEESFDFGDVVSRTVIPLEEAAAQVDEWLRGIVKRLDADAYVVCLSVPSEECWRKAVLPSYKANRDGVVRPELLMPLKQHLKDNHPCYQRPTLEADDVMGILSTHPTLIKGRKIIVSIDKDMKTIPGWLFNPQKDKKPRLILDAVADYWHLYQTLVGDTTDGYKGCPGVGPVKAANALRNVEGGFTSPETAWEAVVRMFEWKKLTEEDALVQARVARICRDTDYDFKKKEVKLWSPSGGT